MSRPLRLGWAGRLHRIADALDGRYRHRINKSPAAERVWIWCLDQIVASQSDRRYMHRVIVPSIARQGAPARTLVVGVRGYTLGLNQALSAMGTELWTCDIDPAAAAYGSPHRHVTADVLRLDEHFPAAFFDLVIMNGVFGWGVNRPEDMNRALTSVGQVLAPGGVLLLGWNDDRAPDPDSLSEISLFSPTAFSGLPQRKEFADVTHVYAWYRKRD